MTVPNRIAMLIPEFPNQTHAFFWREILAMEEAGAKVSILSTRRPAPEACPHAFREEAVARTTYLFPPRLGAVAAALLRRPGRSLRAVGYILGLQETPVLARVKLLALVLSALDLAAWCRQKSI